MNKYLVKAINQIVKLSIFDINIKTHINDIKIKIPLQNTVGCQFFKEIQNRELWLDKIIKIILHHKLGVFIDVGVNLGQTLVKVKSLHPYTEYFGFEPNPICCYYVNDLIRINQFQSCQIVPVGLYNKNTLLKLLMKNHVDPGASLIKDFRDISYSYSLERYVPVFEGDYLINMLNINKVSLIKIDVEGAELEVMDGLKKTISQYQPYILCEVLPIFDPNTKTGKFRKQRQNYLEDILALENYKIYRILRNGEIISLTHIDTHSDLSLCEYIFVPHEETENILELLTK